MSLEQLKITESKIVETTERVMRGTEAHLVCAGVDVDPSFLGKQLFGNSPETRTDIIETIEREPTLQELRSAESLDSWAERILEDVPVDKEPRPKQVIGNALAGGFIGFLLSLGPSANKEMLVPGTVSGTIIGATALALTMRKVHMLTTPSSEELQNRRNEIAKNTAPTLARLKIIRTAIAEAEANQTNFASE